MVFGQEAGLTRICGRCTDRAVCRGPCTRYSRETADYRRDAAEAARRIKAMTEKYERKRRKQHDKTDMEEKGRQLGAGGR